MEVCAGGPSQPLPGSAFATVATPLGLILLVPHSNDKDQLVSTIQVILLHLERQAEFHASTQDEA